MWVVLKECENVQHAKRRTILYITYPAVEMRRIENGGRSDFALFIYAFPMNAIVYFNI